MSLVANVRSILLCFITLLSASALEVPLPTARAYIVEAKVESIILLRTNRMDRRRWSIRFKLLDAESISEFGFKVGDVFEVRSANVSNVFRRSRDDILQHTYIIKLRSAPKMSPNRDTDLIESLHVRAMGPSPKTPLVK
jgi:hypothetical protein